MEFHNQLKELREGIKLNQRELSDRLGVEPSKYNKWESGKNSPSFETLVALARYFNVTTDYLLGITDTDIKPIKKVVKNDSGEFFRKFFELALMDEITHIKLQDNFSEIEKTFYRLLDLSQKNEIGKEVLPMWCNGVLKEYRGVPTKKWGERH